MTKDENKAIGVICLTLEGKEHSVPVYRHDLQASDVPRLHFNWSQEFFGILFNPLNEIDTAFFSANEIRIIEFDKTWAWVPYPVKIKRMGNEFIIVSNSKERDPTH